MMMMMIWIRDDVDIDWPTDDDMFFQQRFWVLLLRRLEVVFFVFFRIVRLSRGVGCDKRHLLNPPSFLEHHKTLNPKKNIPNLPSNFPKEASHICAPPHAQRST